MDTAHAHTRPVMAPAPCAPRHVPRATCHVPPQAHAPRRAKPRAMRPSLRAARHPPLASRVAPRVARATRHASRPTRHIGQGPRAMSSGQMGPKSLRLAPRASRHERARSSRPSRFAPGSSRLASRATRHARRASASKVRGLGSERAGPVCSALAHCLHRGGIAGVRAGGRKRAGLFVGEERE